jgi:hypothetical protein
MTFKEWFQILDDATDVQRQFKRLLDAGFITDNGIDIERHADKRVKGIEPSYLTTPRRNSLSSREIDISRQ